MTRSYQFRHCKKFSSRILKYWSILSCEASKSPSLDVFKNRSVVHVRNERTVIIMLETTLPSIGGIWAGWDHRTWWDPSQPCSVWCVRGFWILVESLPLGVGSLEAVFRRDILCNLCGCILVLPLCWKQTWAGFPSWRVWSCCSSLVGEALEVGLSWKPQLTGLCRGSALF